MVTNKKNTALVCVSFRNALFIRRLEKLFIFVIPKDPDKFKFQKEKNNKNEKK